MVDSKDDDWYLYADDFDLNVPQVCSEKPLSVCSFLKPPFSGTDLIQRTAPNRNMATCSMIF